MTREEVKEQKQRIAEYRMLEQEIFWNNKRIEELGSIPFTEVLPFLNKHRKRFMKYCTSREIDKVREIMLNQLRMITALQIRMKTALQKSIRGIMTRQGQIQQAMQDLTNDFQTYDKLREKLWNLCNEYAKRNVLPDEEHPDYHEFDDFMLCKNGTVALFFNDEDGEPCRTYKTAKIEDFKNAMEQ